MEIEEVERAPAACGDLVERIAERIALVVVRGAGPVVWLEQPVEIACEVAWVVFGFVRVGGERGEVATEGDELAPRDAPVAVECVVDGSCGADAGGLVAVEAPDDDEGRAWLGGGVPADDAGERCLVAVGGGRFGGDHASSSRSARSRSRLAIAV